jgi:cytochrome c5
MHETFGYNAAPQTTGSDQESKLKRLCAVIISVMAMSVVAQVVPPGSDSEIRERLTPFGQVCRAGESCAPAAASSASGGAAMSGEQIYNQFCFACHATGVSEAPILGDAEGWAPRLEKGDDVLSASVINGMGLMHAKGACMTCSDDDLNAAVEFMLDGVR